MSKVKGIDLKQIFNRFGSNKESSLSVNSLSQISDRLITIGRGENIRRVSLFLCLLLSSYFISDLFSLLFEKYIPSPPVSILANRTGNNNAPREMDYEVIANRNLFSSKVTTKSSNEIDLSADPVPTTLPLQLIGTVIFKNPTRSLGAIQDKNDNKVFPVRIGDDIDTRAQILSVEPRRVVFINNQSHRKEYVDIPEDPAVKISAAPRKAASAAGIDQVDENKYVVKRSEIDAQMANFNTLLTQARAVPDMCGGQMVGFKLTQIQPNSFYQKIGLKDNCTIRSVNGEKMTDAAKALSLLQDLKHMNSLDLGVVCGGCDGKESNINYDIQ